MAKSKKYEGGMGKEKKRSYTILVIDDDERIRILLREILVYGGHRVIEASDGISAVKYLEQGDFDMVFTDLGMPIMNGWEVVRWVKNKAPHIPVVLITGWRTALDEEKVEESGVDLIIGKPFQVNEVLEAVGRLMNSL